MIYTVKSLCQITENSSNIHFLFNRFEYTISSFKGSSFCNEPFPKTKLFWDQLVEGMQVQLNLLYVVFSNFW